MLNGVDCTIEKCINSDLRADVLAVINDSRVAFEYQRSIISTKVIEHRSNLYRKQNIIPIWILKSNSINNIMTSYIMNFVNDNYHTPPSCLELNEDKTKIKKIFPISQISPNKIYCESFDFPLKDYTPMQVIKYYFKFINKYKLAKEHFNYKKQWRLTPKRIRSKNQEIILHEMYKRRISPLLIPIEIGVPVPFSYLISNCIVEWQLIIYLFILSNIQVGQTISIGSIISMLRKSDLIKFKVVPNLQFFNYDLPIIYYLEFLCNIGILHKISDGYIKKIREFNIQKHIEEALSADNNIIKKSAELTSIALLK
jgi:competence CoiA-like predicted nuclease